MNISKAGIRFIIRHEGLRLTAYNLGDSNTGIPIWTIGVGHHSTDIYEGMTITKAEANRLLAKDLKRFVDCVNKSVKVNLNQNEFDALVSLSFNIGCSAFNRSTLLRKLNAGDKLSIPFEFSRWVFDGGRRLRGLVSRRADEAKLFTTPIKITPINKTKPISTPIPDRSISPSPAPIREERESLKESRTMKAGSGAVMGAVTAGGTTALGKVETLTEKVSWLPEALAFIFIIGLSAAVIGGLVVLYCRRDDFLKAKS